MKKAENRFVTLLVAIALTSGCTSLHSRVFNDIHKGDSKDQVIGSLGEPRGFQTADHDPNVTLLVYKKKKDVCAIAIKEDKVVDKACGENTHYVNPLALILQGAGRGLQQSAQSPSAPVSTNCTSLLNGNLATTTCY